MKSSLLIALATFCLLSCESTPSSSSITEQRDSTTTTLQPSVNKDTMVSKAPIARWGKDTVSALFEKPMDIDTVLYRTTDTLFIALEMEIKERFINGDFKHGKIMGTYTPKVRIIVTTAQGDVMFEDVINKEKIYQQKVDKQGDDLLSNEEYPATHSSFNSPSYVHFNQDFFTYCPLYQFNTSITNQGIRINYDYLIHAKCGKKVTINYELLFSDYQLQQGFDIVGNCGEKQKKQP